MKNHTPVTEFLLTGIPHTQGLEHALFVFFFTFYLLTLVGNLLILLATLTSSNLHTPMYFFLGNLSVFDIFFPSVSFHLTKYLNQIPDPLCQGWARL